MDPRPCLIANVVLSVPSQPEGKLGTRHFSPGTKVYVLPAQWGDGMEKVVVFGKHRGSPRIVELVMPSKNLTVWRAQLVYKPAILARLAAKEQAGKAVWKSVPEAQEVADWLNKRTKQQEKQ